MIPSAAKIEKMLQRLEEVERQLSADDAFADAKRYKELTQEHSYLNEVAAKWNELQMAQKGLSDSREMLKGEGDPDFVAMLNDEVAALERQVPVLEADLQMLLVPPDPRDHKNAILELRAGTGGDEAALFVADCARMYKMLAERLGWKYELLSCSPSDLGGYREYIMVLSGKNVYRMLRYEAGTHRVQRVPATEAQGRIHTSTITVAVLVEPDEDEEVAIDEKDLRIDTYRSSGAGGQHVNVTDSAVRITHIPTGLVVHSQEERSQHKNRDKAMRLLKAKLAAAQRAKKEEEISATRSEQVGTGERSERIRTYNFPQGRITDHRINYTRYNLDRAMEGELDELMNVLVAHYHQQMLEA